MTLAGSVALAVAVTAAQAGSPAAGRLVEGLRCESDPSQSYTLYLPAAYTPARAWPALLVFDPRGRSVAAAELFRDAAERHGWIVLSSNDTRSDGPMERNLRALQALWPEVHLRYATDPRRVYAAGFSGGGMLAYELGRRTPGANGLAGVIASGARWEPPHFKQRIGFPCFGAAGDTDFNYSRMRDVHARLREWGTPERLEIFEGAHQWMPAELAAQAVAWLEFQAMKGGLRPVEPGVVAAERAGELERARLEALPASKAARRDEGRWDRYEQSWLRQLEDACGRLLGVDPPQSPAAFRAAVRIDELREHAAAAGYEGVTGRRLLETLATQTGFYLARDLLAKKDHLRALAALSVATEAAPARLLYWYNLACAQARAGARGEALTALERAVAAGLQDPARMASDEDLASLREEPRFRALMSPSEHPHGF